MVGFLHGFPREIRATRPTNEVSIGRAFVRSEARRIREFEHWSDGIAKRHRAGCTISM